MAIAHTEQEIPAPTGQTQPTDFKAEMDKRLLAFKAEQEKTMAAFKAEMEKNSHKGSDHTTAKAVTTDSHHDAKTEKSSPKKKWFMSRMWEKMHSTLPKIEARPFVEKLKWGLAGAATVAWLHSSVLFPSLAIAAGTAFLVNYYILKESHGAGHSSGH